MKMNIHFWGSGMLLMALPLAAQVSAPESREELLLRAEELAVKEVSPELRAEWAAVADPFYLPVSQIEEEEIVDEVELSDEAILAEISSLIRPGGILKRGSETLLIIDGNRVSVGQYLNVRYKGKDYKVQLLTADARAFVLRLNDETIVKRIR